MASLGVLNQRRRDAIIRCSPIADSEASPPRTPQAPLTKVNQTSKGESKAKREPP